MLKFDADASLSVDAVNRMSADMFGNRLVNAMERIHRDKVEPLAKREFKANAQGDPSLTGPSPTPIVGPILDNITSGAFKGVDEIVGYTGDINIMDTRDPIFNLRNPARRPTSFQRLWRILEFGVPKQKPMYRRRGGKAFFFFWKRFLTFVTIGSPIYNNPSFGHGPIPGREAFIKASQQTIKIRVDALEKEFSQIVRKYSL